MSVVRLRPIEVGDIQARMAFGISAEISRMYGRVIDDDATELGR